LLGYTSRCSVCSECAERHVDFEVYYWICFITDLEFQPKYFAIVREIFKYSYPIFKENGLNFLFNHLTSKKAYKYLPLLFTNFSITNPDKLINFLVKNFQVLDQSIDFVELISFYLAFDKELFESSENKKKPMNSKWNKIGYLLLNSNNKKYKYFSINVFIKTFTSLDELTKIIQRLISENDFEVALMYYKVTKINVMDIIDRSREYATGALLVMFLENNVTKLNSASESKVNLDLLYLKILIHLKLEENITHYSYLIVYLLFKLKHDQIESINTTETVNMIVRHHRSKNGSLFCEEEIKLLCNEIFNDIFLLTNKIKELLYNEQKTLRSYEISYPYTCKFVMEMQYDEIIKLYDENDYKTIISILLKEINEADGKMLFLIEINLKDISMYVSSKPNVENELYEFLLNFLKTLGYLLNSKWYSAMSLLDHMLSIKSDEYTMDVVFKLIQVRWVKENFVYRIFTDCNYFFTKADRKVNLLAFPLPEIQNDDKLCDWLKNKFSLDTEFNLNIEDSEKLISKYICLAFKNSSIDVTLFFLIKASTKAIFLAETISNLVEFKKFKKFKKYVILLKIICHIFYHIMLNKRSELSSVSLLYGYKSFLWFFEALIFLVYSKGLKRYSDFIDIEEIEMMHFSIINMLEMALCNPLIHFKTYESLDAWEKFTDYCMKKLTIDQCYSEQNELMIKTENILNYELYKMSIYNYFNDPQSFSLFRLNCILDTIETEGFEIKDLIKILNWPLMEKNCSGWYSDKISYLKFNSPNLYKSINGFEIINGKINLLLEVAVNNEDALFDSNDIYDVFANKIEDSWFSLENYDYIHEYFPLQKMIFERSVSKTNFLMTMFHTDYLLKFFATGLEVCSLYPFNFKETELGLLQRLPKHLKDILKPMHLSLKKTCKYRLWIANDSMEFFEDFSENKYTFFIDNPHMRIKNHLLKTASNGKYIDDHQTDEITWASAFCDNFTKHYDEISKYFLEFSRLKELLKLAVCQKRINKMKNNLKLKINASQLPVESNDNTNDYSNLVFVPAVLNLSSCFIYGGVSLKTDISKTYNDNLKTKINQKVLFKETIPKLPIFAPNTVLRHDKTDYSKKEKSGHYIPFQDRVEYYNQKTNSKENLNRELSKALDKLKILKIFEFENFEDESINELKSQFNIDILFSCDPDKYKNSIENDGPFVNSFLKTGENIQVKKSRKETDGSLKVSQTGIYYKDNDEGDIKKKTIVNESEKTIKRGCVTNALYRAKDAINFKDRKYLICKSHDNLQINRNYGGPAKYFGSYFSLYQAETRERLAICDDWNTMETIHSIILPKNTIFVVGLVESQKCKESDKVLGGGAWQVYFPPEYGLTSLINFQYKDKKKSELDASIAKFYRENFKCFIEHANVFENFSE
jgi:hypothetical protein